MTKKPVDRERLKERWLSTQELSGGPYRLGAINRHRQFSLRRSSNEQRGRDFKPEAFDLQCRIR